MKKQICVFCLSILIILSILLFSSIGTCCKDIVACGDATAGDYNLFLKVRDPSRPGLQTLCIVPKGYSYTYHNPWTGKPMTFTVEHKFIGVATLGDSIPNIVKAGMMLSDSGLAYGDADTDSNWKNPSIYAWDDFDWLRYACQKASNEDEAASLLTKDCVDNLHASAVSENLFVVGPKKAMIIEADAFHYKTRELSDGVVVMSNYPKALWKTQIHKKLLIAQNFYSAQEKTVKQGDIIRLGSLHGIKIILITNDHVIARQVPALKINHGIRLIGKPIQIHLGEQKTVGDYSVKVLDTNSRRAHLYVSTADNAWEEELMKQILPRYGSLSIQDMMNLSRLHPKDLDGVRPLCEDLYPYESAMIYNIPEEKPNVFSSGWFSANHACSSIYVPIHILDTEIYNPYTNGEAAQLSLDLLRSYGHSILSIPFANVEKVFLNETNNIEKLAKLLGDNTSAITELFTIADVGMQKQAYLAEQLWANTALIPDEHDKQNVICVLGSLWEKNYSITLNRIQQAVTSLGIISGSPPIIHLLNDLSDSISVTYSQTTARTSLVFHHKH